MFNGLIHNNVDSSIRYNDGVITQFHFEGKYEWVDFRCEESHTWWRNVNVSSVN